MNRRSFISALTAFAGTAVLDPDRLLWRQTKTIFIPKPPVRAPMVIDVNPGISMRLIRNFEEAGMIRIGKSSWQYPVDPQSVVITKNILTT